MKAIIVDDELKARENLRFILNDNFSKKINIVAVVGSVTEAKEAIEKQKPDVIFLDILMKGETGFDLLQELNNINFEVVFTTAYDEYAIQALKLNAADYLLKPIDLDELEIAINNVEDRLQTPKNQNQIAEVLHNISQKKAISKIAIPTSEGLSFVELTDIIRCESDENYTTFHFKDGTKKLVSKTIKFYEELLNKHGFFRTHRSHLVNLDYIKEFVRGDGGYLLLKNGKEVQVSRRKREEFLKLFNN